MSVNKNEVKKLIRELQDGVYQGKIIFKGKLKRTLFEQDKDFWEEFETELKINRKKNKKKHRIPLTLKELRKWKQEYLEWKNFSPKRIKKLSKESLKSKVGIKVGKENKVADLASNENPLTQPTHQFLYLIRSNRLFYLNKQVKELKWDRTASIGGQRFSYSEPNF